MINLSNIVLSLGHKLLFNNVSCVFEQQKIGLVGRNGAGKSTLLKIIAGQIKPDSGVVTMRLGKRIAYMPQELTFSSELSVFDETCQVFADRLNLEHEKIELEKKLAQGAVNAEALIERYLVVEQAARSVDKHALFERARSVLVGLGFNQDLQNKSVQALSLGWRMRVVLAKLLLQDADFYLFDEPTNHLDLVGKEWFFNFLKQSASGFLLVTHDRYFLDGVCERIVEVENGKLMQYAGNFSRYVVQKEEQLAVKRSAYERQQREIEKKQTTIDRFRASANRSKMAQSMLKQLEKIELIEIEPPVPVMRIALPPVERPSAVVLSVKNVAYGYDQEPLFKNVTFEILRGQKVALVAPNGAGKTTLFNILAGLVSAQQGTVAMGQFVNMAFFVQDQARALNPAHTVFEEVNLAVDAPEKTVRALLGAFLFSGDEIGKKISVLSGGEKNRVAMVKIFLKKANFLLLDEPTNHLDLPSKEILCQALLKYDGTMLLVSHDQDFINRIATRILELTPQGVHSYEGNYETYLWTKKQQASPVSDTDKKRPVPVDPNTAASPQKKNKSAEYDHKRVKWLERRIAQLEKELASQAEELSGYAFHTADHRQIVARMKKMDEELAACLAEWQKHYE